MLLGWTLFQFVRVIRNVLWRVVPNKKDLSPYAAL
jgi:hypothetical protein